MHSKGHLRERFSKLVEDDNYFDNDEKQDSMMKVCGQLWNSTDTLPSDARGELNELLEPFFDDYKKKPCLDLWTGGKENERDFENA